MPTISIFNRFFEISIKSASLALFAEDFRKVEMAVYDINSVSGKLKLSFPEQAIDFMFSHIELLSPADDKILILALYNVLSNNLKDIFYQSVPLNIKVMNIYKHIISNAMHIAEDIKQHIEYYNSPDFKNKFPTPTEYKNFYDAFINQYYIKGEELLGLLKEKGIIIISDDGIIRYVDNREPLLSDF